MSFWYRLLQLSPRLSWLIALWAIPSAIAAETPHLPVIQIYTDKLPNKLSEKTERSLFYLSSPNLFYSVLSTVEPIFSQENKRLSKTEKKAGNVVIAHAPLQQAPKKNENLERTPNAPILDALMPDAPIPDALISDAAATPTSAESFTYQDEPQPIPLRALPPNGTQFRLNGQSLNHLTTQEIRSGYQVRRDTQNVSAFQGTVNLGSHLQRSIRNDHLMTIEHSGHYFQTATVTESSESEITRLAPQTVDGFDLKISLLGACLSPEASSQAQCSYTPAISTLSPNNILDIEQLGRIQTDGALGEVVTEASLDAIAQPGFQRGANGQVLGLDLSFPNVATRPGNQFSTATTASRNEVTTRVPAVTFARNRQVIQMNDHEAVMGLTVRGNTLISGESNSFWSGLIQAGSELLPDVVPTLEGAGIPANTQINQNLFLAVNNVRLPSNSFTLYQGGIGRADSILATMQPQDVSPGRFRGLWFGFSPIVETTLAVEANGQVLSPTRTTVASGTEAGKQTEADLQLLSVVNGMSLNADDIRNNYIQLYQAFYETDTQLTTVENYTERTTYHPHISFTGNVTAFDHVFNYYAGAMVANNLNMYAGLDYTAFRPNHGLSYKLGGIVYTNPNRDYYSQLTASLSKRFQLSPQASITLASGLNWALDRRNQIGEITAQDRSSTVYLQANAQLGRFSLGATGNIDGFLPNAAPSSVQLNAAVRLADRLALSGFITPFSHNSNYADYGASLSWQLSGTYPGTPRPTLAVNWLSNYYNYGTDPLGNSVTENDDTFSISLQF
ncbi:MAG: hypothetical protein AAF703_20635 [Cyanobacteria bacterium P01_D01_bin.105]